MTDHAHQLELALDPDVPKARPWMTSPERGDRLFTGDRETIAAWRRYGIPMDQTTVAYAADLCARLLAAHDAAWDALTDVLEGDLEPRVETVDTEVL